MKKWKSEKIYYNAGDVDSVFAAYLLSKQSDIIAVPVTDSQELKKIEKQSVILGFPREKDFVDGTYIARHDQMKYGHISALKTRTVSFITGELFSDRATHPAYGIVKKYVQDDVLFAADAIKIAGLQLVFRHLQFSDELIEKNLNSTSLYQIGIETLSDLRAQVEDKNQTDFIKIKFNDLRCSWCDILTGLNYSNCVIFEQNGIDMCVLRTPDPSFIKRIKIQISPDIRFKVILLNQYQHN